MPRSAVDLFHGSAAWESPERSGEGRLRMRSPLLPYPSAEAARAAVAAGAPGRDSPAGGEGDTPWRLRLDGSWRFALAENPASVPRGVTSARDVTVARGGSSGPCFADEDFDDSGWGSIRVPGTWTLQGYDKPHYTNVVMPFGNVPPSVPSSHNPTGLYRVPFEMPGGWKNRRVVLHVGGAESFLEAWCNGKRLGFSKDTRLPSEFDLTPFVSEGSNLLAFMVAALFRRELRRGPGPMVVRRHLPQRLPLLDRFRLSRRRLTRGRGSRRTSSRVRSRWPSSWDSPSTLPRTE